MNTKQQSIGAVAWIVFMCFAFGEAKAEPPEDNSCKTQTIVLDPGHGGRNMGAKSADHLRHEKHFTLSFSKVLKHELEKHGLRVIMTRTKDKSLTLRQRMRIAHQANADRFMSIHANASTSQAHLGYETYYLSAKATDTAAMGLRRNEGLPHINTTGQIKRVLHDALSVKSMRDSRQFANDIQDALAKARPKSKNRGVKQGNHHVLLGATMPAVLIELGFIDHPVEGPELFKPESQQHIAKTLAKAVFSNSCTQHADRCVPAICKATKK